MNRVVLEVAGVSKEFSGRQRAALEEVSFSVTEGEFVTIVGPSGCGKSTLLKCVCGLMSPSRGEIRVEGRRVMGPPPGVVLVFQEYNRSLFPWLTVMQNVMLPLRKRKGLTPVDREGLALRMLAAVGLDGFVNHYPWELSGGMQQRVAIARALAFQPRILLMDEPFGSVDALTRMELEDLLLNLWTQFRFTTLLVTHDVDEAIYLADRVLVFSGSPGRVVDDVPVHLPRPRDQIGTRSAAEFASLRSRIFRQIGSGRMNGVATPQGEGRER
ncbi:MAG: ABC transporter ATP-binding protein [Armatimonadetes bacterium]|nr:ABC transporter ATP-binding protein [Armatimonadota bacterium]MDW8153139.1 ABC transporter ATP-binding protein [Armatimonadota bacterium]